MAEVLPADNVPAGGWERGVTVGATIPTGLPVYDFTAYGGVGDGVTDNAAAWGTFVSTVQSAAPSGAVLYVPEGTWVGVNPSNIVGGQIFRGAGMFATFLTGAISVTGDVPAPQPTYEPNGMFTGNKGDTSFVVTKADNGVNFTAGKLAYISAPNDMTIPTVSWMATLGNTPLDYASMWASERQFIARITNVSGPALTPTITIDRPIPFQYGAGCTIGQSQLPDANVNKGWENFHLDATGNQNGITVAGSAYNVWIKNVGIDGYTNYGISLLRICKITIQGCLLYPAPVGASNHAGILTNTVSGLLVENNIIQRNGPAWEINKSTVAGAFLNNLIVGESANSNHGGHNQGNLYENNIICGSMADSYFGSLSHDVYHRNWIYGVFDTSAESPTGWNTTTGLPTSGLAAWFLAHKRASRYVAVIKNIFGSPLHTLPLSGSPLSNGQPNMSNVDTFGGEVNPPTTWWYDWDVADNRPHPVHITVVSRTVNEFGNYTNAVLELTDPNDVTWLNNRIAHYTSGAPGWLNALRWTGLDDLIIQDRPVTGTTISIITSSTGANIPAPGTTQWVYPGSISFQETDTGVDATMLVRGNKDFMGTPLLTAFTGEETSAESYMTDGAASVPYMAGFSVMDPDVPPSAFSIPAGANYMKLLDTGSFDPDNPSAPSKVATPSFSPAAGAFETPQTVTITCSTADATIHYTVDDSTPSELSPVYTAPIEISSTTVLKAFAVKTDLEDSNVRSGMYTISASGGTQPKGRRAVASRRG